MREPWLVATAVGVLGATASAATRRVTVSVEPRAVADTLTASQAEDVAAYVSSVAGR